jgi:predicted secreted hydrolase
VRTFVAFVVLAAVVVGCSGPILAVPPAERPSPPSPSPTPARPEDPVPIVFPADDGPHDRLTEWWYYTGHLSDEAGRRYGFEFVVFRAERGDFPVSWASHLAITDEAGRRFLYGQRSQVGPTVDVTAPDGGFGLRITGDAPATGPQGHPPAWSMERRGEVDRLVATMSPHETEGGRSVGPAGIELTATTGRSPTLHDSDGWVDFGPAGGSYYYSRTRMQAGGTLTLDGIARAVSGTAWFDHQWGDFIAIGGGWDWFAMNLDDGTDITISQVRDADGRLALTYGTLVRPDGSVLHLSSETLSVNATARWTSPETGADYPAAWTITVLGDRLLITLEPTLVDQELDTRPTTGVVYWEGSQRVRAVRDRRFVGGEAYVELTGYATGG